MTSLERLVHIERALRRAAAASSRVRSMLDALIETTHATTPKLSLWARNARVEAHGAAGRFAELAAEAAERARRRAPRRRRPA